METEFQVRNELQILFNRDNEKKDQFLYQFELLETT